MPFIKRNSQSIVIGTARYPDPPDIVEFLPDDHPDISDYEKREEIKILRQDAIGAVKEQELERLLAIEEQKYEIDPDDPSLLKEVKDYFDKVSNRT